MYLEIIIFIFYWINSSFAAGAPQLTCSSQTLSAVEGGAVERRIWMDPPTNITDDDLIIERADLKNVIVYHYDKKGYHNNHAPAAEYKFRISVIVDPIRGVLDLEIRNLSLNDSGSYRASSTDHGTDCTFNISVGRSQKEPLWKTVLPASVVPVIFIFVAVLLLIYLWRSGRIRTDWTRVRDRVRLLFGGQGPDPDAKNKYKPVPEDDADPQVVCSAAHECSADPLPQR